METCRFILYLNLLMVAALFGYSLGLVVAGNIILGHDMRIAQMQFHLDWLDLHTQRLRPRLD
jgi:hypothetical protein